MKKFFGILGIAAALIGAAVVFKKYREGAL